MEENYDSWSEKTNFNIKLKEKKKDGKEIQKENEVK